MNSISMKGALRYDLKATLRSLSIFLLVMILVWLLNYVLAATISRSGSYSSGFEMGLPIFMFVAGIISIREDLRVFLQNGRGRPTVFLAQVIVAIFASAVLALAVGLFTALFHLITAWVTPQLTYTSIFGMLGMAGGPNEISAFPESVAFMFLECLPAFFFGMAVSLIYYRLSKLGKVVFSVAVPGVLFVGLPVLLGTNPALAKALVGLLTAIARFLGTPLAILAAFSLVSSPILALGSWLLLRKAPIK